MEIILSILQILGIVLLGLLGLAIVIILLILFVPVRYIISGEVQENVRLEGRITWLFHFLRAKFIYEDELLYAQIGILWKKIQFSKEFGVSEEDLEEDTDGDTDEFENHETVKNELDNNQIKKHSLDEIDEESSAKEEKKTKAKQKQKSNESLSAKIDKLIQSIKDKIAFIKKKIKQIKTLITDEKNKLAVKHLKDEMIYLIKIILPKKSSLKGVFSTGSPDTTGQALGVLSWLPIMYQKNWSLVPDFEAEKAYFEGEFYGKGRIYVFQLVGILLRIMIDKNCRRLYYILKRLGGRTNGRRK